MIIENIIIKTIHSIYNNKTTFITIINTKITLVLTQLHFIQIPKLEQLYHVIINIHHNVIILFELLIFIKKYIYIGFTQNLIFCVKQLSIYKINSLKRPHFQPSYPQGFNIELINVIFSIFIPNISQIPAKWLQMQDHEKSEN